MWLAAAACAFGSQGAKRPVVERPIAASRAVEPPVEAVGVKHLLRGLYFLHTQQPAAAVVHLRLALLYAPESAFVYERLSRAWGMAGERERARQALEVGLEKQPSDPWLNWLGGELALSERRFLEARAHLGLAVVSDEVVVHAGPHLIDALLWLRETDRAHAEAESLVERRPADADLAYELAARFEDHGQLADSLAFYRRARVQRPDHRGAASGEMRVLVLRGEVSRAVESLAPLFTFYPEDIDLYIQVAHLMHLDGRAEADTCRAEALRLAQGSVQGRAAVAAGDLLAGRVAKGLFLLRQVVGDRPEAGDVRLFLADMLLRQGDVHACLKLLSARSMRPSARFYRLRARCLAAGGELELAMEEITRAVLEEKRPRDALLDAVYLLSQTASEPSARSMLNDLLIRVRARITPVDALVARAQLCDLFGRGAEALELLAQISSDSREPVDIVLRRVDLQARHGELVEATRALETLLRERPSDPVRLNALGYTLANAGVRLAEAEVYLRRAHRMAPDDGYITDSLGWFFYRQGRVPEALRLLETANRASPGDPEILHHLGDAYLAAGKGEAARAAFRAALDARPPPRLRDIIRERLEEVDSS
jgi:tetratricopeptide (TPR) repeat protein